MKIITNAGCSQYSLILEVHFIILHPPWNKPVIPLQEKTSTFSVWSPVFFCCPNTSFTVIDWISSPTDLNEVFNLNDSFQRMDTYPTLPTITVIFKNSPTKNGNGYCEFLQFLYFEISIPFRFWCFQLPRSKKNHWPWPRSLPYQRPAKRRWQWPAELKSLNLAKPNQSSHRVMEILLSNWIDVCLC